MHFIGILAEIYYCTVFFIAFLGPEEVSPVGLLETSLLEIVLYLLKQSRSNGLYFLLFATAFVFGRFSRRV